MRLFLHISAALCLAATQWGTVAHGAGHVFNENFDVFTPTRGSRHESQAFARKILEAAESYRQRIAVEWLSKELPRGIGHTTINVVLDADREHGLTWARDNPQRRSHTLYVCTNHERAVGGILAHEMTHAVLASRFPHPRRLPAWLEEGIAGRYDDVSRRETRREMLGWWVRTGNWPNAQRVLSATNLLTSDREAYTVATSLVDYLLSREDRPTLIAFGQQSTEESLEIALAEQYRLDDVDQLIVQWQAWVAEQHKPPRTAKRVAKVAKTFGDSP